MTVLENIHQVLEANEALLVNLQDDQEKIVTLITELKTQVAQGAQVTPAQLEDLLSRVTAQKAALDQLNVTQDAALEAATEPETPVDPEEGGEVEG